MKSQRYEAKIPNVYNSLNKKVFSDWAYASRFIQLITMSSCVCRSTKRDQTLISNFDLSGKFGMRLWSQDKSLVSLHVLR